ncbi:fatty acid desaturase [Phaeobacter marinintestinus]|uniref:fatty acid desaturase n=1 Tax=Falsiphaeobacter marinintestinus TaxID=1492905 RepID=UPI0011B510C9|nr:fatty acid desaturase [Phaeobacter marinintestinus]
MSHIDLLKSLPPKAKADLTERSDRAGLRHLALHLGAIALTTAGIIAQIPLWPLLLIPQGILLVFLFTLSHECTHQTPFRTRWLNDLVGHAIAPILVLPFIWFRYFHLAHHRFTNDPRRDPELEHGPRPETRAHWLIYLSGWGYWRGMARTLWQNAFGTISAPYLPPSRHRAMRTEARVILALYALALLSLLATPILLILWLLPVLIAQPFLRLYLLAEHGLCPPVADMLENSRTTFTTRLIRALAWNMPYHAEHHSYPNVPFHKLPAFHAWTASHLKSTSDGYTAFTTDYVRQLRR